MGSRGSNEVPDDLFAEGGSSSSSTSSSSSQSVADDGKLKHPVCVIFHVGLKVLALSTYLFGTWFIDSFAVLLICCVVFLSADFWTVKNVSGRLLVGLRWWNEVKEDGASTWIFESQENTKTISGQEKVIFWGALLLFPVLWLLLGIVAILKFIGGVKWLLIIAVALVLQGTNIMGYMKCARADKKKISSMAQSYLTRSLISQATGGSSTSSNV